LKQREELAKQELDDESMEHGLMAAVDQNEYAGK
jgi:hypothetical protein